jgi:transposase
MHPRKDRDLELKGQLQELKASKIKRNETPDKQISLAVLGASLMKTRGSGLVGYNVQATVDTKHYQIVTHEVTSDGVDRDLLCVMAKQA